MLVELCITTVLYGLNLVFFNDPEIEDAHATSGKLEPWSNNYLFFICFLLLPRFSLLFMTSLKWKFWFVLCSLVYPQATMVFMATTRGYYEKNPFLYGILILLFVSDLLRVTWSEQGLMVAQLRRDMVRLAERNSALANTLLSAFTTNDMLRNALDSSHQLISQLRLSPILALLHGEKAVLDKLNAGQLRHLITWLQANQDQIQQVLTERRAGGRELTNSRSETCAICMEGYPEIKLLPCTHQCLCESCFQVLVQHDQSHYSRMGREGGDGDKVMSRCPICRELIFSHEYAITHSIKPITMTQYHQQATITTTNEMLKMFKYVRENATVLSSLRPSSREALQELY